MCSDLGAGDDVPPNKPLLPTALRAAADRQGYGHAPDAEEFRACLAKHIAFWQERARKARTGFSVHYMANPVLDVQGRHATGTWYFLIFAQAKNNPGGAVQNIWGYYEDQYVKAAGSWRFSSVIANYFVPPPAP